MKATGIVRRIDDLGRVVIPKEIRRTLRIKEGDPLEIFLDNNGGVVLKRYSPLSEIEDFADQYAQSLHKTTEHIVIITDTDHVIAVSGINKNTFQEKILSSDMVQVILNKTNEFHIMQGTIVPIVSEQSKEIYFISQIICPIISEGDAIGSVILVSKEKIFKPDEVIAPYSAAVFLGKQMEV